MRRYLRRVRRDLLATFLAFGGGAGFTWFFRERVFALLTAPAGGYLSPHDGYPVFISPTEVLSATIRLSITGGVVAALPVLAFGIFRVVSPILTRHDRRLVALFLPAVFLFFLAGVSFAYFVMLPVGVRFLLHFGEGVAVPMIRISEYMNLVMALMLWLGLIFEIPLAMFLLVRVRAVSYERLKRFRRYLLLAAPFLSIFITPTFDPVNMLAVFVPIVMLYEVGLVFAWLARPKEEGHRSMVVKLAVGISRGVIRFVPTLVLGLLVGIISGVVDALRVTLSAVVRGRVTVADQANAERRFGAMVWWTLRKVPGLTVD